MSPVEAKSTLKISSLDDHEIHIPDTIRCHLESQYVGVLDDTVDGTNHMEKVLRGMKNPPLVTTLRINRLKIQDDNFLLEINEELSKWKTPDNEPLFIVKQNNVLDDVYEVISNHEVSTIDSLRGFNVPPIEKEEMIDFPNRSDKKWPVGHKVVICDPLCGEAVLRGSNIFVRGVMVADAGIVKNDEVAVYAHISNKNERILTRGMTVDNYHGNCVFLGLGMATCSRSTMFNSQQGLAVEMSPLSETIRIGRRLFSKRAGPIMPPLNGVLVDKMMLQNLPSALVAHALSPKRKDVIFDMCSAPGGKTAHVASLVSNDALIVAADKSRKKMTLARTFFNNAGATCIHPLSLDSTKCIISDESNYKSVEDILHQASSASKKDGLLDVKGFYVESFDRIVLDPPCSALGLRPKLRVVFEDLDALERHTIYQRKFVKNAVALLKRGGTMTYSTCTINASENEGK